MSYTQIYYHIVFSTKNRLPTFHKDQKKALYNYLWGILKNKKCHLYQMGGVEDHIHMLTSVHSTISIADLIRDLKTSSLATPGSLWSPGAIHGLSPPGKKLMNANQ